MGLYPVSYSPSKVQQKIGTSTSKLFLEPPFSVLILRWETAVLVMLDWNTEGKVPLGKRYLMNQQCTVSCMFRIIREPSS